MVAKGAEISLGVRIESLFQQLGDDISLIFEASSGNVHHSVKTSVELFFVLGQICDARQVDSNNAHRARALAATEETTRFLSEFSEVESKSAAHTSYVAWLHVAVDIVGEVRGAVLGSHLKQESVVLGVRPVEVLGDRIGRDRILETSTVGVALNHDFDKRLVDHSHLVHAVLVFEVNFFSADDTVLFRKVGRNGPVKGNVGKRSLRTPTARGVDAVDKGLQALLNLFVGEVVYLDERSKVGIEGRECLRACPFVLHDTEEVDHLVAKRRQVSGRCGGNLTSDSAQTFLNELSKRPTCAVAGKHRQVVYMNVGVAVCVADFFVVNFAEPIVGGDSARVGKDKSADGIGNGGVLFYTPVLEFYVTVDELFVVENSRLHITDFFSLFTIQDISSCNVGITRLFQNRFYAVLDAFYGDLVVLNLWLKVRGNSQSKRLDDAWNVLSVLRNECSFDGFADFT